MKPQLGNKGFYGAKDQAKSDRATCFIGRGSVRSSTHRYMLAWGTLANKGEYTSQDVVFISAEGNRSGRLAPDMVEIALACHAGAKIITDTPSDRQRDYNKGERDVAIHLTMNGYHEVREGQWTPKKDQTL